MLPLPDEDLSLTIFTELSSSTKARSFTLTLDFIIPMVTVRLPFASGRVLTVPFIPIVSTSTISPMCSCLLPTLFLWLSLALMPLVLVTASIFSRSLVLSSSISLAVAPPSPHLLYFLMEASAISLASDSILEASLLASASRLSFFSASFSTSVSKALFSFSISALLFFILSSSSSMN